MANSFFRKFPMNSVTRNHIPNNDNAIEGCGHKKISMDTSSSNDVFFVTFLRVLNENGSLFRKRVLKIFVGRFFLSFKNTMKFSGLEPGYKVYIFTI